MISESLTVLLPVYNEQDNMKPMLEELDPILKNLFKEYVILVVESGSTDNTAVVLEGLKKEYSHLEVINEGAKNGLGSGIKIGLKNVKTDIVVYMDSDLPFDLKVLERVFPIEKDTKVLIGYKADVADRESFARYFFSRGYNWLIRVTCGVKVKDVNYSFKVLRKEVLKDLPLISRGWFIDAEILARITKKKYKIAEVPIKYKQRQDGASTVSIGYRLILEMLKELWEYKKDEKAHS